jgi:hypothetical protein
MIMQATWKAQAIDEWTVRRSDGQPVRYRIAGNNRVGFFYSAAVGVKRISVVTTQSPLTRDKVESLFARILACGIEYLFRAHNLREAARP